MATHVIEGKPVKEMVSVKLPTDYGEFCLTAFTFADQPQPTLALMKGSCLGGKSVPVRLHSACLTGDVFGSERCDCGAQLRFAMRYIDKEGLGMIIYLPQEGRGVGLIEKLRAYKLQEEGLDTVDANLALGLPVDCREYSSAVAILSFLSVKSIQLMTNNPDKSRCLAENGIRISRIIPILIEPNSNNYQYLFTKFKKMGHLLSLGPEPITG